MAITRPSHGRPAGCGCNSAASSRIYDRAPNARCRAGRGTSCWGALLLPLPQPRWSPPSAWPKSLTHHRDVGGLEALASLLRLVLDLLALVEVPETGSGDVREVDEDV